MNTRQAANSTLDALSQALEPAEMAMKALRRAIERCWPRKPSLTVLDSESHALYRDAMHLVEAGGGRFASRRGTLVTAIAAAYDTLNAFGHGDPSDSRAFSWMWNATEVDKGAPPHPDPAAATSLLEAATLARASHQQACDLLDEIARLAPAESWLPDWDAARARAYVVAVGAQGHRRWQPARPPQPPHSYTVRTWNEDLQQQFLAFAQLIQARGELKIWRRDVHAYYELDGLQYWTMGARVPETTVINRAPDDAAEAARALSTLTQAQLQAAVERALAYRRARAPGNDTGILSTRLRALLDGRAVG